jgi:uncharacterized protein (TIGR03663 family)
MGIRIGWRAVARGWPWWLLLVASVALHLWGLGDRTFHHDEAIHAHSAWTLLKEGTYRYDPTYHGPLLYLLTAAGFAVFGAGDVVARLPVAVAGIALVGVAWSLRRPLGPRAAWWTGALATLSPLTLYYGRFLRMDVLEMVTASAGAVALWRAGRGRRTAWIWAGLWIGLALATKENAYVTMALVVAVWAALAAFAGLRQSVPATWSWLSARRWGLMTAAAVAVMVVLPLYTVGFSHPEDWWFPGRAIAYWWGQHSIERVAGPRWYHLPRLALYEFLPIVAAFVWAARRRLRMGVFERSLLVFGVASIAMYCYLGEKVAWLGVHQVWAFLPLAGMQLARTFGPRGRWWSRGLATAGLAATVVTAVVASFVTDELTPAVPRAEALIYVQTCPEMKPLVQEGRRFAAEGEDPAVVVAGSAGWPFTWYWRDIPIWWSAPAAGMRPPLVLCDPADEAGILAQLGPGYRSERLPLRAWWLMEQAVPGPADVLRYVQTRTPWGHIGSSDVVVLRRAGTDDDVRPATDVPPPPSLAAALPVLSARRVADGWLVGPRAVAVAADGTVAVANTARSTILLLSPAGRALDQSPPVALNQPEAVAWLPGGVLAVADTWNHRVVVWRPESGSVRPLPEPPDGWYGPRSIAAGPDGRLAVADTGHKRIILYEPQGPQMEPLVADARDADPPGLVEPVGVAWLTSERLLVCDTGHRRILEVDRSGHTVADVALPEAWSDFYSRPQMAVIRPGLWIATDAPARGLWLVEAGQPRFVDLGNDGITPAGVAFRDGTLWITDLGGALWAVALDETQ